MPPWFGPPDGALPGVVAIERIVAQTDITAVCVTGARCYPAGCELDLVALIAGDEPGLDALIMRQHHPMPGAAGEVAPEILRFGVELADGRRATNVGGLQSAGPPPGPVMLSRGSSGGGGRWSQALPPPGPLQLVCEWPALEIPLTRVTIDAQPLLDAAARARVIHSDEHLPEPPGDAGWARYE